jgi:hypothetical protein
VGGFAGHRGVSFGDRDGTGLRYQRRGLGGDL